MKKLDILDSFWPFPEYFGNNFMDRSNHTKKSSFTNFSLQFAKKVKVKNQKIERFLWKSCGLYLSRH